HLGMVMPRHRSARFSSAAALLLLVGCSAAPSEREADGQAAQTKEAVETGYQGSGRFYVNTASPANDPVLAATGAVFVPIGNGDGSVRTGVDGTPLRATCGVTFISSHYAITAAHCVPVDDVPDGSVMLSVQQFDVSQVAWSNIVASENETNSIAFFPNYQHQ